MKKIFVLLVLTSVVFASCRKPEEKLEVEFSSRSYEITNNTVEVELNSVLNVNASIFSSENRNSTPFWNKSGENYEQLSPKYQTQIRESTTEYSTYIYDEYNIPISDSLYQSGDHYVLSVRFGENNEITGDELLGGELHVYVK